MKSLYWLRSDLRTRDNEALTQCSKMSDEIVFIFSQTKSLQKADRFKKKFIEESVDEFEKKIKKTDCLFIKSHSTIAETLPELIKTHQFDSLFFTSEYAWDEKNEENLVRTICQDHQIAIFEFDQGTLIAQEDLPFKLQDMPFVFTDFRKKIEANLKVRPLILENYFTHLKYHHSSFLGGEDQALGRLEHYLWKTHAIKDYKETRNGMIHFDDSSKLSPWLNSGCLSARTIYHELKKYENEVCKNESTYWLFFELLWRDYFKFFSLKFGRRIFFEKGINPGISPNLKDTALFTIWSEGKTQDEFVNANMNELNQTGWMSNRGRQNVASYLIHDLGLDWRWGASYFEHKLIDYDPDVNWGNWLYLSGRGSDPRARKFNTALQAQKYDPVGEYQRIWRKK